MRILKLSAAIIAASLMTGCFTRIETGTTGIRINASKEIEGNELLPGSWNQTFVGDVLVFPTKDITVAIDNKTPLTSENTPLSDFDISIVYGVNPTSVADIWSTKSKSFHSVEQDGDILLMHSYMATIVNNAAYKVVRQYKNLEVADNRQKIEAEIRELVSQQLTEEKLGQAITLSVVQVRNVQPNAEILKSATEYVRSLNELKTKQNEILIAEAESKRMAALAQNSEQSIAYLNAQANMKIAEAIAAGKIGTILVPHGFTALGGPVLGK
jgi:hypothetical protein